jgi:hypothetical protein
MNNNNNESQLRLARARSSAAPRSITRRVPATREVTDKPATTTLATHTNGSTGEVVGTTTDGAGQVWVLVTWPAPMAGKPGRTVTSWNRAQAVALHAAAR